jgi:hypothetical protein
MVLSRIIANFGKKRKEKKRGMSKNFAKIDNKEHLLQVSSIEKAAT